MRYLELNMQRQEKYDIIKRENDDKMEEAWSHYESGLRHHKDKMKSDRKKERKASLDSYRKMNT